MKHQPNPLRWLLLLVLALLAGGLGAQQRSVVAYVSMDSEHSERILKLFEQQSGIKVLAQYDTEDNKTVGLTNRIIAERETPRCDVFWNNEVGQTVRLKILGLLQPYASPSAATIPATFKDPQGYWAGFAARARVLIYNKELIKPGELPRRLKDLLEPRYKGRFAMSRPLTGTGLTHAGALYAAWGAEQAERFYRDLSSNGVRWERGNAQVMKSVARGSVAFGMTDTDDARVAVLNGEPTDTVYLDQGGDEMGTLVIPNTVAVIKDAPHPAEARALIDFLLSPRVETLLAEGRSAQIPLHPGVACPAHVKPVGQIRAMQVDFADVGRLVQAHADDLERLFDNNEGGGFALGWALGALVVVLVLVVLWLRGGRSA